MLYSIKINNIALIDDINIIFSKDLNILTGQTGSGKSIIIDSLNFLLGSRSDKSLIRSGMQKAIVKGVFILNEKNNDVKEILANLSIPFDTTLILERSMSIEGNSIFTVNGDIYPVSKLKSLFESLINIHSQNDFLKLLSDNNVLNLIDSHKKKYIKDSFDLYSESYSDLIKINNAISSIGGTKEERLNEIELTKHEIAEIESIDLTHNIDEELKNEFNRIFNSSKIIDELDSAIGLIMGDYSKGNEGAIKQINNALYALKNIKQFDSRIEDIANRLDEVVIDMDDISNNISAYANSIDYDKNKLEEIDDKIELINNLKRKYGGSIDSIIKHKNKSIERLRLLSNSSEKLKDYNEKKIEVLKKLKIAAIELSRNRMKSADCLSDSVVYELKDLGMKDVNLLFKFKNNTDISLSDLETEATPNGIDYIEILFSANKGEPLKSILKIISGGELSRVVLAIKSVIANNSSSVMIFDEIDTGMSGEIALSIGKKFAKIAKSNQVLAVSHLPQVSAMADNNIHIYKTYSNNKTITKYKEISGELLQDEIAKMISGSSVTDSTLKSARELLELCDTYKKNVN